MHNFNHSVYESRLPHGTKLISIESANLSYSIIAAGFPSGSHSNTVGRAGLAHLAEHLFMRRTRSFSSRWQKLNELESLGINFEAVTYRESVLFYHTQLSDFLEPSLTIFWDGLTASQISRTEFERERHIILNEYRRNQQEPEFSLWDKAAKALWPSSSLSSPITGTPLSLKNISLADVKKFCSEKFHPAGATYLAIGNKKEITRIKKFLSVNLKKVKARPRTTENLLPIKIKPLAKHIIFCPTASRDSKQVNIGLFIRTIPIRNENERLVLAFIKYYLAGSWISRLNQILREKKGLTYWVVSDSEYFSDTGYMELQFSTKDSLVYESLKITLHELKRLKDKSIQDINPHKNSLIADVTKGGFDPENLLGWYYPESVLSAPLLTYDKFINSIKNLRESDIQKVAQKYLSPDNLIIAIGMHRSKTLEQKINKLVLDF